MAFKRPLQDSTVSSSTPNKMSKAAPTSAQKTSGEGEDGLEKSAIPRPPPHRSITFTFWQRSWEEISAQNLCYIPMGTYPGCAFDDQSAYRFLRQMQSCYAYTIKSAKTCINNFIVLNDQLSAGGSTPSEISSIVQRAKIVKFTPHSPWTTAFRIRQNNSADPLKFVGDTAYLAPPPPPPDTYPKTYRRPPNRDYLMKAEISSFEDLEVEGLMAPDYMDISRLQNDNNKVKSTACNKWGPYVFNGTSDFESIDNNAYLGNVGIQDVGPSGGRNWPIRGPFGPSAANVSNSFPTINAIKNMQGYQIISPGEELEFEFARNVQGKMIEKTALIREYSVANATTVTPYTGVFGNPIVQPQIVPFQQSTTSQKTCIAFQPWPTTMNPLIKKSDIWKGPLMFDAHENSAANHVFLTMIPIKETSGSILKQRCNCQMQQEVVVEFHYNEMMEQNAGDTVAWNGHVPATPPFNMYNWRSRINYVSTGESPPAIDMQWENFYV